jgi:hypothetical protein
MADVETQDQSQFDDREKSEELDLFMQLCDLEEDELLRAVERMGAAGMRESGPVQV